MARRCRAAASPRHWSGAPFGRRLGQPVAALLEYISGNMPYDNPGGLTAEMYLTLVAFLARSNGFTAGATPLPADAAILGQMGFRQ